RASELDQHEQREGSEGREDRRLRLLDQLVREREDRRHKDRGARRALQRCEVHGRRSYVRFSRLTWGVDLSPATLEIARARARELGRDLELRVGDAQALEFPDESFDTVVCTVSPCTIPNDRGAVAEVRLVLRPGGRF